MSRCSSTEVGSSNRMSNGCCVRSSSVSALASSTIWRAAKGSSEVRARRVDLDADLVELLAGRIVQTAAAQQPAPGERAFLPEVDVLRDGKVRQQGLLLENDADAVRAGVARVPQAHRLAAQAHGAAVGRLHAGEDAHERGLARPVFPDQPDDLALGDLQGNVHERPDLAEPLAQLGHREQDIIGSGGGGGGHLTMRDRRRSMETATATRMSTPWTAGWR